MGSAIPWMIILIFTLIVLLAVIAIWAILYNKKKGKKRPMDYQNLFNMGVIWFIIGLPLKNVTLWALGLGFMIAGLVHKKEWKKNRIRWEDLSPAEKKIKTWGIAILSLLFLMGLIAFIVIYKFAK
jgi:hypothetical protein